MAKVGRNDPCPCGSGVKYKHCCGNSNSQTLTASEFVGVGRVGNSVVAFSDDMLINLLKRDSEEIETSFDKLCNSDLEQLSDLCSRCLGLLYVGRSGSSMLNNELCHTCSQLLFNAVASFSAAVHLLRSGYRLQPGILMRNLIEVVCTVLHLMMIPEDYTAFKTGTLKSSLTVSTAKKIMPIFGQAYGYFSENFTHIGLLHRYMELPRKYDSRDVTVESNLRNLR